MEVKFNVVSKPVLVIFSVLCIVLSIVLLLGKHYLPLTHFMCYQAAQSLRLLIIFLLSYNLNVLLNTLHLISAIAELQSAHCHLTS